jgi:hypothetical protein
MKLDEEQFCWVEGQQQTTAPVPVWLTLLQVKLQVFSFKQLVFLHNLQKLYINNRLHILVYSLDHLVLLQNPSRQHTKTCSLMSNNAFVSYVSVEVVSNTTFLV